MADTFGAVTLPASASDDPIGDPALRRLAQFVAAVINANCTDAWQGVSPAPQPVGDTLPVQYQLLHNPQTGGFNHEHLPALFAWRERGKPTQSGADRFEDIDQIELMWIFPSNPREEARNRDPFVNIVKKSVGSAITTGRISTWVDDGDTDPTAATVAASPDSFLLAKATALTSQSYSGAGIDGALGDDTLSPRLGVTISLAAASSGTPYNTSAPIVVTYVNAFGVESTAELTPTSTSAAQTLSTPFDVARVVSVAVPAQNGTTGSIRIGNAQRTGRGSSLFGRTGFDRITFVNWRSVQLQFDVLDGNQRVDNRLPYRGICITFEVIETMTRDLDTTDGVSLGDGADLTVVQGAPFDAPSFTVERTLD